MKQLEKSEEMGRMAKMLKSLYGVDSTLKLGQNDTRRIRSIRRWMGFRIYSSCIIFKNE